MEFGEELVGRSSRQKCLAKKCISISAIGEKAGLDLQCLQFPLHIFQALLNGKETYMSLVRKPVFGVSDQVSHNRAVQSQKMARGLKFWI